MHKILPQENWLGININEFIYKMGGEKKMYSNKNTYNLLMSKINEKKVLDNLKKFISTKGYSFEYNLIKYIQTINKL